MLMHEFIDLFGLKKADVENWLARPTVQLHTKYQKTNSGRSRRFTRLNVTELALIGAFVASGVKASDAALFVNVLMDEQRFSISGGKRFYAFAPHDHLNGVPMQELNSSALTKLIENSPRGSIAIIDIGGIFQRVETLFAEI